MATDDEIVGPAVFLLSDAAGFLAMKWWASGQS
jgi:hypothetical protein